MSDRAENGQKQRRGNSPLPLKLELRGAQLEYKGARHKRKGHFQSIAKIAIAPRPIAPTFPWPRKFDILSRTQRFAGRTTLDHPQIEHRCPRKMLKDDIQIQGGRLRHIELRMSLQNKLLRFTLASPAAAQGSYEPLVYVHAICSSNSGLHSRFLFH